MTEAPGITPRQPRQTNKNLWVVFVSATAVSCVLQLWWFARTCFNEIDFDGMAYVGIARHIRQGQFRASISAFRSPLISWLIAAVPFSHGDFLHIGKLVNMGSFLLTCGLLYVLTAKLWHSRLAASLAAFLFALGRGLAAASVESVVPDFLFAALTLVYFLLLLRALRRDRVEDWFIVGSVHALAYLCKAFALPWLAVCTVSALAISGKPWKTRVARLSAAAIMPVVIAASWAAVIHSKYGVFTTGSQFKTNLLQSTLHAYKAHHDPGYALLRDTSRDFDQYTVGDPMPPGSWPWSYHVGIRQLLPNIVAAEERNVPQVIKEMLIVATPGGILAFVLALAVLARNRHGHPLERQFAAIVAVAAVSLVLAYCMLVFDSRYLYPLIPLLLAIAAGFLAGESAFDHRLWRRICLALVVAGVVISLTYRSSPFRALTRDFQASCYEAANRLKTHGSVRLVSLGEGPFPEHGVGWEAGYKTAFFAGSRIVGTMDALPDSAQLSSVMLDVERMSPDAILVWGKPDEPRRASLIQDLVHLHQPSSIENIVDPGLGEVGVVMFR